MLHLGEQLDAIRSSCESFDLGSKWEAKRIAASIYILMKDGRGQTKSLVSQLGIRALIPFLSSVEPAVPAPKGMILGPELFPQAKLLSFQFSPNTKVLLSPKLQVEKLRCVSHDAWWGEPVYEYGNVQFSRNKLIETMRNQDGGGHVDADLDEEYMSFCANVGDGLWTDENGGLIFNIPQPPYRYARTEADGLNPIPNAPFFTMRQIGFEILQTFAQGEVQKLLR